jgi:hypothetical protein
MADISDKRRVYFCGAGSFFDEGVVVSKAAEITAWNYTEQITQMGIVFAPRFCMRHIWWHDKTSRTDD